MIKSIANFSNTRKYVKSEYSWRSVINQLVSEYKYVWNKYYARVKNSDLYFHTICNKFDVKHSFNIFIFTQTRF